MKFWLATIGLVMPGTSAMAQSCDSYVGQSISPLTFSQAITRVPNVQPKGEFETTIDFETRKQAAAASSGGPLLISKAPEDRKYFEYNADTQMLGIKSYAFHNQGFEIRDAFREVAAAKLLTLGIYGNLYTAISVTSNVTGSYEAQNSYGAKFNVARVARRVEGIFVRPLGYSEGHLFPSADKAPYIVGYLNLSIAEAQRLKPLLRLAYVVEPKAPYLVKNSYSVGTTSPANPFETTEEATVLIADFKCGLVTDDKNVVLGAYPTR